MSGPSPSSSMDRGAKGSSDVLAFLVHSHPDLPPEVDNEALARQKRRRTRPEDQAILEAEYKRNPKPDKAARMEIVKRVGLGEREVQIWFQNKRQSAKRKCRPLEISSPTQTASEAEPSLPIDGGVTEHDKLDKEDKGKTCTRENLADGTIEMDAQGLQGKQNLEATSESCSDTQTKTRPSSTTPATQKTPPTDPSSSQPSHLRLASSGPGYLANRRSASFVKFKEETTSEETRLSSSGETRLSSSEETRLSCRSASYLRLSMSDDGHAKVIDRAAPSPNPPRTVNVVGRSANLRRSYSTAGLKEKLKELESDFTRKIPRTSAIGRSRDSRAWEFWCDSDARNSLSEKADQELSGSAANAISLLRANNRAPLQPNQSRRNVPVVSQAAPRRNGKPFRPTLTRASTSHGRLRTRPLKAQIGDKKRNDEFDQPNTDSDKENWEPEDQSNPRRQHTPEPKHRPSRRVLGQNMQAISQGSSLGAAMASKRQTRINTDIEVDDDVARFMAAGSTINRSQPASTPSGGSDELDCVQSLLSLSQGNWK